MNEEQLRDIAAKNVTKIISNSGVLSAREEVEYPLFLPKECISGVMLGKGGFSVVHEIKTFECEDDPSVLINKKPLRRLSDHSDILIDRKFLSETALRQGKPRYAIKMLMSKTIKLSGSPCKEDREKFIAGVIDLALEVKFLSNLDHPNIIRMRGMSALHECSDGFFIILDRLYSILNDRIPIWDQEVRRHRGVRGILGKKKKMERHFVSRFIHAYDIIRAVQYMHSRNIIYRDLKPENIGFDVRDCIKIFDFGLAREALECDKVEGVEAYIMSGDTGSLRYMAPEVAQNLPYNHKVDVYAFGLILWQMCTLKAPFEEIKDAETFRQRVVEQKDRPSLKMDLPCESSSEVWKLIESCWHSDFCQRYDSTQAQNTVREILFSLGAETDELDHSNDTAKSYFKQ